MEHAQSSERYRAALVSALGTPFFEGSSLEILRNGVEIFPAMLASIDAAQRSIDFLTYIYWTGEIADRFADRLSCAAARGVRVRVLLDGIGAMPMKRDLASQMERAGVELRWFRPPRRWVLPWTMSHRTHRKVLVCDGTVGFTGGVGVGEEWEGDARGPGEWRDTHFRVRGPALRGLEAAFIGNWLEVEPEDRVVPGRLDGLGPAAGSAAVQVVRSSAAIGWSDMTTLLHTLLGLAERRIRISTPYFVPDDPTIARIIEAVRRGVSVELLVPGEHIDHRVAQVSGEDHYDALLDAGVRIWEYVPTMIHQKITVVDSTLVAVGSGNLNQRSLHQDDELQLVVDEACFCRRIEEMLDDDWSRSEPVEPGQWKRRGLLQRIAETATRPFRGQL